MKGPKRKKERKKERMKGRTEGKKKNELSGERKLGERKNGKETKI